MKKMNKYALCFAIAVALSGVAGSAIASSVSASVTASSDYIYRGQSVTGGEPTVSGTIAFSDVLLPGVYVRGEAVAVDLVPLNDTLTLRGDVGVGYEFTVGLVDLSAGVNRVINPVVYRSEDYTEVAVNAQYNFNPNWALVGDVAVVTGNTFGRDTYVRVGVETYDFLVDGLAASAGLSHVYAQDAGVNGVNNLEVGLVYDLTTSLSVGGLYSWSGSEVSNWLDDSFRGYDVGNRGLVSVTYTFD